ncbi:MAG: hypothetical protein C4524_10470 [Candidatus Zixiibacteriota bacterium]|nr:MAG: hypothetical protein C4524_10470 [candidate division Zixibacteria bacterium]
MIAAAALLAASPAARADQRAYVWTYQYQTMERGQAELEHYFTVSSPDLQNLEGNTASEQQLELEIGMTDRFDFSLYQVFGQNPSESLKYKGYKLRSRYRFGERGGWFVDPLVYLEYKGKPDFSEHVLETKLILARDFGPLNLAVNPVLEVEKDGAEEWEFVPMYAAGASYAVSRLMRLGVEAKGSEDSHYLGPVIAHGYDDLWVALGSALAVGGVEEGATEFQVRFILGFGVGPNR